MKNWCNRIWLEVAFTATNPFSQRLRCGMCDKGASQALFDDGEFVVALNFRAQGINTMKGINLRTRKQQKFLKFKPLSYFNQLALEKCVLRQRTSRKHGYACDYPFSIPGTAWVRAGYVPQTFWGRWIRIRVHLGKYWVQIDPNLTVLLSKIHLFGRKKKTFTPPNKTKKRFAQLPLISLLVSFSCCGDAFVSTEDVGFLEHVELSLNEPKLESGSLIEDFEIMLQFEFVS